MKLYQIERRTNLSREEFQNHYLKNRIPVIFTDLAANWEATNKWTFDWLSENYGHIKVPLFANDFHKAGKSYMTPKKELPFGEYLALIQREPTELRMFLFNIFNHAPELLNDFSIPTIMDGFITNHPYMFFGGEGSFVNLHYDIDCSSVFLTQFQSRKKVLLFSPKQSVLLYQHPYTVQSHIDVLRPDYKRFPALKEVEGHECVIKHGETLYIPSCYWHYILYVEGGYSLSLRANDAISTKMKGAWNISRHFFIDKGMNYLMGKRWKTMKVNWAEKRAMAALKKS